ncbi:MAG: CsbD family protein, partial [Lachnospiraceae bacterium]
NGTHVIIKRRRILIMSEEKLKSKIEQASGVLKEGPGKLTGDKELEAKGFVEKTIAKGKELADDAKEAVEGAVDAVEEKLK